MEALHNETCFGAFCRKLRGGIPWLHRPPMLTNFNDQVYSLKSFQKKKVYSLKEIVSNIVVKKLFH